MTRESGLDSFSILRSVHQTSNDGTSRIIGQVRDRETYEPIWGAEVILLGTNLGSKTDSLGNYDIKNIPVGHYRIEALYLAYHKVELNTIHISENDILILDFFLAQKGVKFE
jgi:hypothetical protein